MSHRSIVPFVSVVVASVLLVGCNGAQRQADGPTTISQALLEETERVIPEALEARAEAGRPVPGDYEEPEFIASVSSSMRLQFPEVYRVTEGQEQRLREGEVGGDARRRLERALEQADEMQVPLHMVTEYLVDQYQWGELEGARLELAARLVEAHIGAEMDERAAEGEGIGDLDDALEPFNGEDEGELEVD